MAIAVAAAVAVVGAWPVGGARAQGQPAGAEDGLGETPWYRQTFETNLKACTGGGFKPFCADWINALEASRPREVAPGQPEWRQLSVGRVFDLCDSRLPPDWCGKWREAMKLQASQPAYLDQAERAEQRAAESRGRRQALDMAWKRLVYRASINQVTQDDLIQIKRLGMDGNVDALELLAWIYTEGRRGIRQDFAQAYELYGFAVLAGRDGDKKNLEAIWAKLNEIDRRRLAELFRTAQ